jgi:hypothetical protein
VFVTSAVILILGIAAATKLEFGAGRRSRNSDGLTRTIEASASSPSQRSSGNSDRVRGCAAPSSKTAIETLRAIRGKIRPEPAREPLPPPKRYEPPRALVVLRRRAGR